ncbi:MAG: alpha-ketoglutarate-dependent dioxygenase AlkB [Xanthomonadales bacterium]|nr:alpha-ketoglutarate-dependent dioxygenase AlkB [Xanthomonadales bacterium]
MHPHPCGNGDIIEVPDGELFYAPTFFDQTIGDRALHRLLANDHYPIQSTNWHNAELEAVNWETIQWQQDWLTLYGKQVPLPRLSAWYGDDGRSYTYSGLTLQPKRWNQTLLWLRGQLEACTGIRFNSVLLNWYRSGADHISWHRDAEPELGMNPTIASLNFGATRRFVLRRCNDHRHKIELALGHGSLLVMRGALQHHWEHSVPKQKAVPNSRVNLTFRVIQPR